MKNIIKQICTYGWLATAIILLPSCSKPKEGKYIIRIDMSKEHDAGRFKPELKDKIVIAGDFNGWDKEGVALHDTKGDWVFSAELDGLLGNRKPAYLPQDTLTFKFILRPGDNREIANQGWEKMESRKITLARLEMKSPMYTFNEVYDERESYDLTFKVGMNNQKILGFFRPEDGDEVVVSGSFCEWSSTGVPMKAEGESGIYTLTVPVKHDPKVPFLYRFRILTKRQAILPNKGWETQTNRQWTLTSSPVEIPYAEFNDIRRVARFVIDTKQLEQDGKFHPRNGDILQVRLLLDGKENLSDALFQVKDHTYETALIIPLTVKDVQWQIVKNMKEDITSPKNVEVDLKGTLITL